MRNDYWIIPTLLSKFFNFYTFGFYTFKIHTFESARVKKLYHSTVDATRYVQSVFDSVEVQNKDQSDQSKIELPDSKNDFSLDDNSEETTLIIDKYNINDDSLLNPNTPTTTCEFLNGIFQPA